MTNLSFFHDQKLFVRKHQISSLSNIIIPNDDDNVFLQRSSIEYPFDLYFLFMLNDFILSFELESILSRTIFKHDKKQGRA